ncbi:CLUMA_CG017643, isoform A [Clunio marinus]|uniref:CLUMA_CG017643, isoform A n=1 Tax=Clunio marinus TaxID=568069 RepID=A0A1J1IZI1_9DIPT|nr:CLUMA_CG017643, isoform A [Clunio marinus]
MMRSILTTSGRLSVLNPTRSFARKGPSKLLDQRLTKFCEKYVENDLESFEETESDFMNVHEAHKDFEEEERKFSYKVSRLMVGRKYFKEKTRNFLTWFEKDQIRILHSQDSKKWTIDYLSEAFPADPAAIKNVIRTKPRPVDANSIKKHDEAVKKAWDLFKKGELELDSMMSEHLKKFSHRKLADNIPLESYQNEGVKLPKPKRNEFESIITSCKKYSNSKNEESPGKSQYAQIEHPNALRFPNKRSRDPEQTSTILESNNLHTQQVLTLKEYQKLAPEIVMEDSETESKSFPLDLKSINDTDTKIYNFTGLKHYQPTQIREKIKIPRSIWKKDKTYKVEDCFYDDNGEFLYRVPGLV